MTDLTKRRNYELSLIDLLKTATIKDVYGYASNEFGDPVFKMTRIIFSDGTQMDCEGEHDIPYLVGNRIEVPEVEDE
jgi:hypothetical protein